MMLEILLISFKTAIHEYSYQAIFLILILSGPPILVASVIGLFVAIFQAATQIQEQTLSFAIKMVAVMATVLFMGGWLSSIIYQFAITIFTSFPKLK